MKAVKGLVSGTDLDLVCVPIKLVWFLGNSKLAFGSWPWLSLCVYICFQQAINAFFGICSWPWVSSSYSSVFEELVMLSEGFPISYRMDICWKLLFLAQISKTLFSMCAIKLTYLLFFKCYFRSIYSMPVLSQIIEWYIERWFITSLCCTINIAARKWCCQAWVTTRNLHVDWSCSWITFLLSSCPLDGSVSSRFFQSAAWQTL